MRIHHVAVGSKDVRRLGDFLERALELELEREHHYPDGSLRSLWYQVGTARIMVEHTNDERARVDGVGAGPFLVALSIDAAELDAWRQRLDQAGIPIETSTAHSIYFRDPDHNRWALSHFPEP